MKAGDRSGKLAVILHADVVGSTRLVQENEQQAHERIQDTFQRFDATIGKYHGQVRELRGDALLAEFERASDAVTASLAFQAEQTEHNRALGGGIKPEVRVGIAMGEVIIADDTITGAGVVLAQRIEQMTEPGGVGIQGAAYETIPGRFPYEYENMGEHTLKGFDNPVRLFAARLRQDTDIPLPSPRVRRSRRTLIAAVAILAIAAAAAIGIIEYLGHQGEAPTASATGEPEASIAVLPFENLGGGETIDGLAHGIAEDVTTALSGLQGLFVVSHKTAFSYEGKSITSPAVARELGVRYVIEGSARQIGDVIRVNVELVDGSTDRTLWAKRYDGSVDDTLAYEDEVIASIVEAVVRVLELPEPGEKTSSSRTGDAADRAATVDAVAHASRLF